MNATQLPFVRLHNQGIQPPRFATPQAAVAWLGAMQGQDYAGVKWSIGLRVPGSTDARIEQAFAEKQLVRTWALRGTLHVLAAEDLRWLLALLRARVLAWMRGRLRELELDEKTLIRSSDLIAAALRDGAALNRNELFAMLDEHGLVTAGQRGVYMLNVASFEGLICQIGATRNSPIFCAIDATIPTGKTLTREEALVELAGRYFTSHGPTTVQDFAWWAGLTVTDARIGLAGVQDQLANIEIGRKEYWWAESEKATGEAPQPIHLLPGFDEYLLGYGDRNPVLDPQYANRIVPGGNGVFYPTVIHQGQVIGTWKRVHKKAGVTITPAPFTTFDAEHFAAMTPALQRYGQFLELPVSL